MVKRSYEIEVSEQLTEGQVEAKRAATAGYLIAQHREVVEDLRRDNGMLREENRQLR